MKEIYDEAVKAFDNKQFINALKLFSSIDYEDSKEYENKCIDYIEDLIFYSSRKKALMYLKSLEFYKDYQYFEDAYKRKKIDLLAKILMFVPVIIATIILIIISFI